MTALRVAILLATFLGGMALSIQKGSSELEEGKALYRQGRFGLAVAKLQTAILTLQSEEDPGARALQEEAYLYLGLTYVALDDPDAAKSSFKALLRLSPQRTLDPQVYAPKVVELFDQAKQEVAREEPAPDVVEESKTATTGTSSVPGPSRPSESGGVPAAAWGLLGAGAGAGGVALVSSLSESTTTSSSTTTSTTTTSVLPQSVEVDLRLNGVKRGTFSCSQSLTFTIDVINSTSQVIHVEGFDLNMISLTTPTCQTHRPPVDGLVNMDLLPGARVQIRQTDLTGDLCQEPAGAPGCEWRTVVRVVTSDGEFQDDIQFTTGA